MENLYELAKTGVVNMSNQFCGNSKKYPIKQFVDFESPVKQAIKNVKMDKIRQELGRKVGRNEECPCGSGKKFKKCCGNV